MSTASKLLAAERDALGRWLFDAALPLWWRRGADHVRGGFYDALTLAGEPLEPRRARVQCRQVFVYATAGRLGWDGPWREAAWHGMDYFLARYRRPDGLFRARIDADGGVLDETAILYEQAFALLALAALHQVDPGRADLAVEAERLAAALDQLRHRGGGWREAGSQPFQANAQMHLLEAVLAWSEQSPAPVWMRMARELVDLALNRFIDASGGLREVFDADWRPAAGDDGRLIEPGHQFEWAWLLHRWGDHASDAAAAAAARRLYEVGLRGIDPVRGIALDQLWDDLSVRSGAARLWPQTEWVKAALIFGEPSAALGAARALRSYLDAAPPGLWRENQDSTGRFLDQPAPASSFYHVIGAISALLGQSA